MESTDTEEKFPLIVYEMTDEFQQSLTKEQERLKPLITAWRNKGGTCTSIASDWECSEEGVYKFWFNDGMRTPRAATVDYAQQLALQYGDSGWWTVDEFEQFVQGEGPIFEGAMHELGFQKGKKPSYPWVRRKEEDKSKEAPTPSQRREITDEDEVARLMNLLIMEPEDLGSDKTMGIEVAKSGMIFAALRVNPFGGTSTETMGRWAAGFKVRGHFAKQQEGYIITAEEVMILGKKFIYVTTEGDCKTKECLWPTSIGRENFVPLLKKFVGK